MNEDDFVTEFEGTGDITVEVGVTAIGDVAFTICCEATLLYVEFPPSDAMGIANALIEASTSAETGGIN